MNVSRTMLWSLAASVLMVSAVSAESISFDYTVALMQGFNNDGVLNTVTAYTSGHATLSAGNITVYTTGSGGNISAPTSFINEPASMTIKLADSGAAPGGGALPSGSLTFNGVLSSITPFANAFRWDYVWNASAQSVTLGSPGEYHTYTVQVPSILSSSTGITAGAITAGIGIEVHDYQPGSDPARMPSAPEPASLVLAALSAPALLIIRRKRRPADGIML
jgi:hypothetical protein